MKNFLTSFTIKDMYLLERLRKTDNSKCWEDYVMSGAFYTAGGSGKCYNHFRKLYCSFLKRYIYNFFFPMSQQFPFQVFTQEKLKKLYPPKALYKNVQTLFTTARDWKQPRHSSTEWMKKPPQLQKGLLLNSQKRETTCNIMVNLKNRMLSERIQAQKSTAVGFLFYESVK